MWLNLTSLFFTFCAIGGMLIALSAVVVFPLMLAAFGWSSLDAPLIGLFRWPVMFVMVIVALAILYRYGPSRRIAKWRWLSVGSHCASAAIVPSWGWPMAMAKPVRRASASVFVSCDHTASADTSLSRKTFRVTNGTS